MFRHQRIAVALLLILLATSPFVALHNRKQAEADQAQIFGRYTRQQFIDSCRPLLAAIVPDRDDIYITTDPISIRNHDGSTRLQWDLEARDGKGNQLVHIVRDGDSGRVCLVGQHDAIDSVPSNLYSLTEQKAILCAQNWLRLLEYKDYWLPACASNQTENMWVIFLRSQTRKAQINLYKKGGTLAFARITPLHE